MAAAYPPVLDPTDEVVLELQLGSFNDGRSSKLQSWVRQPCIPKRLRRSATHVYSNATGHAPSVYVDYTYTEGSILSGSVTACELVQYGNIIQMAHETIST